ncbi:hypothetical protein R3I93_002612 [Phoxinus phoxinus]|uniref:Uncharacterized protein n=1 Tax=Phoxinus phoxinus TaxID=58324 RepID=A0AAN9DFY6_9TELE
MSHSLSFAGLSLPL